MKEVFADTLYWVALVRPADPWRDAAVNATERLGAIRIVTTEEVLTEALNALGSPRHVRQQAIRMVRRLLDDSGIAVLPQSQTTFLAGVGLFEKRPDKEYSLTDCISMESMRSLGLTEILTNDHHFTQEDFTVLIVGDDAK